MNISAVNTEAEQETRHLSPIAKYPCAKQTVTARLVCLSGKEFTDTNWCRKSVTECPRAVNHMETGQGYDLCRTVCDQSAHAEVNVCRRAWGAGEDLHDAILYLTGHTYVCDACKHVLEYYGIHEIHIGEAT